MFSMRSAGVACSDSSFTPSRAVPVETIVRHALSLGELLPGAAALLDHTCSQRPLTSTEQRYLEILADAIAHNTVRRISL